MSIYFEVANLSYELKNCTMDLVTPDIIQFFKEVIHLQIIKLKLQIQ